MSSRYQSTTTTSARNTSSNNYNANTDNRLDELLEDLQSTVSLRPQVTVSSRPQMNGGGTTTGYKEVMKSVKTETMGKPVESSKEYHIEYLNPSNSTTIIQEQRSSSPYFFNNISNSNNSGSNTINSYGSTNKDSNLASYKTVSYEYNNSYRSGKSDVIPSYEKTTGNPQVKFRQNIDELDTLLDDLNHSQKATFPPSVQSSQLLKNINTFPDPLETSTPQKKSHVERVEHRTFEEQRYGSLNPSPIKTSEVRKEVIYNSDSTNAATEFKKDLKFTGGSSKYRYDSSHKSTEIPPIRNKMYDVDTTDHATPFSTIEKQTNSYHSYNRSPSPAKPINSSYNSTYIRDSTTRRSPSPVRSYYTPSTPTPSTKTMYSSVKTMQETNTRESTKSPSTLPYRSPSPVSFALPPESPEPTTKTFNTYEMSLNKRTPQLAQKFSPSDPTRDTIPGHTVITKNYKYSSQQHTSERYPPQENGYREQSPLLQRPFPSPSPTRNLGEQKPPKQLDELMASFSDTHISRESSRYNTNHVSRSPTIKSTSPPTDIETTLIPTAIEKIPEKQKIVEVGREKEKSNGVAGPPVYYPPGPLFTKKEESAMMTEQQSSGKGKMKANRKAKYKYESGSKMTESSDIKKTIVPVCCPCCCGLPCVIM